MEKKIIKFSTKAKTLANIGTLTNVNFSQYILTMKEWKEKRPDFIQRIKELLGNGPFAVRSSHGDEDKYKKSNAGKYDSLLNVSFCDLEEAVETVIQSYSKSERVYPETEVLVQEMVKDIYLSGVALSHDPNTSAPYRIINWSDGFDTTSITGGTQDGQTWIHAQSSKTYPSRPFLLRIFNLLNELLLMLGNIPIDCEFCFSNTEQRNKLWLLQVRPLVLKAPCQSSEKQEKLLREIEQRIDHGINSHPILHGNRKIYGVMPDWNPAEIIGIYPRPLA